MTISSTVRKAGPFAGHGTTSEFPFEFKVFSAEDLYVVQYNEATNLETVLALDANYTVTLNADQNEDPGGTVELTSNLPTGYTLTITSDIGNLQPTDLTNRGGFYPSVINDALDRSCIQIQQLAEDVSRAVKVALSSEINVDLPHPTANELIGWDATATNLVNINPSTIATVVAYATAYADTFEADGVTTDWVLTRNPAVLYNLDVSIAGVTQVPVTDYTLSGKTFSTTSPAPAGAIILVKYKEGLPNYEGDAQDVRYVPSGTGAVETNVAAKLSEIVSVKDFGAVGDGVTDDTAAIQAAITAVGSAGAVIFPDGNYRTTATIEIPNLIDFVGYGAQITAAHDGVVLRAVGISGGSSRNSNLISSLRFANASGFTPAAYVEIGKESVSVGLNVTLDKCLFINCAATYGVLNTAGYGTTLRDCVFNTFAGICVKTRQSPSDNPYWSYSVALYSCDITNITGSGLDIATGDVMIYGGLIEGCSAGGIDFWTNASGTYRAVVGIFGTYFEGNQGHHIKCSNPGTGGNARLSLQACRFTDGAYSSVLLLNNCSATIDDCLGIPSATITGGTVRIRNSYGMFSSSSSVSRVVVDNWVQQTSAPATPVTLNKQINVNSSFGGGAALILCSHQNSGGDGTNAELFLIRYGNDGNNFAALSLGRSAGTDTNTYTFTVDANGFLQIASGAGNARYMVVANMCGFEVNF